MCRLAIIALFMAGCGYVGDPLPPALNIPARIMDLRATQTVDRLEFAFTLPAVAADGVGIRRLAAVELLSGGTPVKVERLDPGEATATHGVAGMAGQRLECKVRTQSLKGRWSEWSPSVEVEVVAPLAVPGSPRAESHPTGVRLSWIVPDGQSVRIRKNGTEAVMAKGSEWIDQTARMGEAQIYTLQAVHPSGAQSDVSRELGITPEDIFPPSVPGGLTGVAGIGTIEVAWDPSPESDLAGYRVYRSSGAEPMRQVGETTPATAYSDRDVKPGASYRYSVAAVDRKGNESGRSEPVEIAMP